ncbi:MAG: DNA-3-methyladenine glycosylase [Candidatus Pacebacteria bacterium]|nr:DNA-3-methyladenine glycosylase [Candidatus Paceibacterota bacterium]MDD5356743.1 DNA-3-methyladenine glycosylase [Candidatus Paceibacterota bacterium]
MKKVISQNFFNRPILKVAPDLLGKYLVRKIRRKIVRLKITEVEAYDGEKDLACHACRGRTQRTEIMYGEAGRFYIYLCYGMYWMLNIVTGPKEYPAAVLIRGVESFEGPGKLTRELRIDKRFNKKIVKPLSGLWIESGEEKIQKSAVLRTARIGVSYAGPIWSKRKYRFVLKK